MPDSSEIANNAGLPETATAEELGFLFDLSPRRVRELSKEGLFPRTKHGRYDLKAAVAAMIRRDRDETTNEADAVRLEFMRTKSEALKMETAKARGELIPLDEALDIIKFICGGLQAEVMAAPKRATRDREVLRKMDTELGGAWNKALRRINDAQAKGRQVGDKFVMDMSVAEA